jgi:hypothetical protein
MSARNLLRRIQDEGIVMRLDDGRIRLRPATGRRLPSDVVDAVRRHQIELRAILRAAPQEVADQSSESSGSSGPTDFETRRPPTGRRYIARCPDPARPGHDRAVVIEPGTLAPAGAWAWREYDGETWFRIAREENR